MAKEIWRDLSMYPDRMGYLLKVGDPCVHLQTDKGYGIFVDRGTVKRIAYRMTQDGERVGCVKFQVQKTSNLGMAWIYSDNIIAVPKNNKRYVNKAEFAKEEYL